MQDDLKLYLMNGRFTPTFSKALLLFCGLLTSTMMFSQDPNTMICNDNIQLSLATEIIGGTNVCGVVDRDAFLENPNTTNAHVLEIDGGLYSENTIAGVTYFDVNWVQYVGQTIDYKIIDAETSNSCWGTATVEANVTDIKNLPCSMASGGCETWCPSSSDELSIAEMEAFLANSCFAKFTNIFKNEVISGDACSGLTKTVKWSGTVDQHGEEALVNIGTQLFIVSPLSLFIDGGTGPDSRICNIYNPPTDDIDPVTMMPFTGSGILCMPVSPITIGCKENADDLIGAYNYDGVFTQPLIVNHHKDTLITKDRCIILNYKEVVDVQENAPTLITDPVTGDEIWILVDNIIKESKTKEFCSLKEYNEFAEQVKDKLTAGTKLKKGNIVELDAAPAPWPVDVLYEGPIKMTLNDLDKYACNTIKHTVSNDTIPSCGNTIKIVRLWTLVDWCTSETKVIEQLIEVGDNEGPKINKDPGFITVSIEPWSCVAPISLVNPGFVDVCGNDFALNIEVTDDASGIWLEAKDGVPVGSYTVTYTAVDVCGNKSVPYVVKYDVVDKVKPVAVCEDNVVVSLTDSADGAIGKAFAEAFDKASHDGGCAEIKFREVIRMDHLEGGLDCDPFTESTTVKQENKFGEVVGESTTTKNVFGPHVKFCCNEEGEHLVVLRVWDGISDDRNKGAGNFNDCMVQVTVQNKLAADISCVPQTIVCTAYNGDPKSYGGFVIGGSDCAPKDVEELDPIVDISSCGDGSIIRTFVLAGGVTRRCVVTVTSHGVFDPKTIKWPLHHTDDVIVVKVKELDSRVGSDTFGECVELDEEDTYTTRNLSCGEDAAPCVPTWTSDACGLVGVSHTDEIIEFDQDACYKIIRRWSVVDWCTWGPNDGNETLDDENDTSRDSFVACSDWCTTEACNVYYRYDDVEADGYYTFDQVIKVVDKVAPEATCTAETVGIGIGDGCVGDITFSATAVDGSECPSEEITYSWIVRAADGSSVGAGSGAGGSLEGLVQGTYTVHFTARDGCGNSGTTSCEVTLKEEKAPTPYCYAISTAVMNNGMVEIWASEFIQKGEDNCTAEEDLLASFSGDEFVPNLILTCEDVTGREKNIRIYLWDEAGNADFCVQTIRVDSNGHCDETGGDGDGDGDGDGNTGCPDTEGGVLITDPTDLDELTICVGDGISDAFDAKIWENLGDASWLITDADANIIDIPAGPPFNFEGAGEGVCLLWHVSSFGELTGVEVGANASDIGGCFSLSNPITVTRVSSGEACEAGVGNALIAGNISTEKGDIVSEAEVMLSNNVMPEYPVMDMSSERSGNYAFESNPINYDYALSASKDVGYNNGVSTLDLVLIQKHILGLRSLDSPYKVIAADVNGDQNVSASDLVQLRQLILGTIDGFSNNQSWRFVDAAQTFSNNAAPWPFTEVIDVSALSNDMSENFIGVKIGDVNIDAQANSLTKTEVRSNGKLVLTTANATVAKNNLISVAITSDNFSEVYGFQFTMQHAGLRLVDVVNGALDVTESNIGVRNEVLTMSWNNSDGVSTSDVLFTLNFEATNEVTLSEVLNISSRITSAEAYLGASLDHNDVGLVFNNGETAIAGNDFALHQNEPNPFSVTTSISFELPSSDRATITVFDVAGKLVTTHSGQFTKGLNTVNFSRTELGTVSGILYYQLSSGEFTATKKMIIIE